MKAGCSWKKRSGRKKRGKEEEGLIKYEGGGGVKNLISTKTKNKPSGKRETVVM